MTAIPQTVTIGDRRIGDRDRVFVIAEAGVNHNGDVKTALAMVDTAAEAGADAIKFQTFRTEEVVTAKAPKAPYQLAATSASQSQHDMLKALELSRGAHYQLKERCQKRGLIFLSTAFDQESADFLEILGLPAFKVPSGEVTNFPFLEYVARKKKPIIMSTGMSYLGEVDEAVRRILALGSGELVLLHCVSNYPAEPVEANLRAILTMSSAWGLPVGYSDHTLGHEVALAAVALGAAVIEKHFTLDRTLPGPDHRASLNPRELTTLVRGIRTVEDALGHGRKEPAPREHETAAVARRSLVAGCTIEAGTRLTQQMIRIKRPGSGLPPSMLPHVVGRRTKIRIFEGDLLTREVLE